MAPPHILVPVDTSSDLTASRTLQGSSYSHFISKNEFQKWSRDRPSIRPSANGTVSPPEGAGPGAIPALQKGYK
ncbi:hypothetical protein MNV49_000350 [Pseudohyphozyma bogoriensis]|nr:hypothetical protein MNV49_000350 [Pseudohyphozyma bogoriensis]